MQSRGIVLRFRRVAEITDGLEAEHGHDLFFSITTALCISEASHLRRLEKRRLLIRESYEAKCRAGFSRPAEAGPHTLGEGQHGRHAAGVVVSPWRAEYGVVVCAHDDDLVIAAQFRFDVRAG